MKQLLTVNNENVLRFRHECFLMKNLSHPHVVNLVGVCWSEDMFACCLEFVENGSLEDWLRRTAGGKVYVRKKKPVIGKPQAEKKPAPPPLADVAYKGFNWNDEYNPAEITELDEEKKKEVEKLQHEWWMGRMNPKFGFERIFGENGAPLELGAEAYQKYDVGERCSKAIARVFIKATPAQVAGVDADDRGNMGSTCLEGT
jgi:hypothetical protein